MRFVSSLVLCLTLSLGACGDDHDHDHESAPTPVEVTNTLTMSDWQSGDILDGVELCYTLTRDGESVVDDCVTTDAEGKASFSASVLEGDYVVLRGDKEGYFPFLSEGIITDPVAGETEGGWIMGSNDGLSLLTSVLDAELDDAKGHATVVIVGPADADGVRAPVAGATLEFAGNAAFGPEYTNTIENFGTEGPFADPANGTTASGTAGFFNVDPGTVHVTVNADGHVCAPGVSGLPSDQGTVSGLIEAGRVTYFTVRCELAE